MSRIERSETSDAGPSLEELLRMLGETEECGRISHPNYAVQDDDSSTLPQYTNDVMVTSPESGFASDSAATIPSPDYICLDDDESSKGPYLKIVEEPEELFRYRYLKEAKVPHGPINGCRSGVKHGTSRNRVNSGPKVKLFNFTGEAIIRCRLTIPGTSNSHVHQLVATGKLVTDKTREPHDIVVNASNLYTASFDKLNIIHAVTDNIDDQKDYWKRKHLIKAPFDASVVSIPVPFDCEIIRRQMKNAEKNLASLHFEAFALENGEYRRLCAPAISRKIRNTKNPQWNPLKIYKHLPCRGSCEGNEEAILLVDKIVRDVKVRFFELNNQGEEIWGVDVKPEEVHKQVAIVLKIPPYKNREIPSPVQVQFKIVRNEDESPPKKFIYLPSSNCIPGKKRRIDTLEENVLQTLIEEAKSNPINFESIPSVESGSYRSLGDINVSIPSASSHHVAPMDVAVQVPSTAPCDRQTPIVELALDDFIERDGGKPSDDQSERGVKVLEESPSSEGCRSCLRKYWAANQIPLGHQMLLSGFIRHLRVLPSDVEDSLREYNQDGETVLLTAVKMNDVRVVEKLLELRPSFIEQKTLTGDDSAFHVAVQNHRREIVASLIKMKFNWNITNGFNLTPLHYAVRYGDEDVIRLLLSSSEVDIRPKLGCESKGELPSDDISSDEESDDEKGGAHHTLRGPSLNKFVENEKIFRLLQILATRKPVARVTIDDIEKGRVAEQVCVKLARALNLPFLRVEGSKQPFSIIKSYLEVKMGVKEARKKIESVLSVISTED